VNAEQAPRGIQTADVLAQLGPQERLPIAVWYMPVIKAERAAEQTGAVE
jgi:hypothetical protein